MTIVTDRLAAEIFVVEDVLHPGQRISWASLLTGAFLATPLYLKDKKGPYLKLVSAVASRKDTVAVWNAWFQLDVSFSGGGPRPLDRPANRGSGCRAPAL
jgi:hypothetical protein